MTQPATPSAERTLWSGSPSPLADLASYAGIFLTGVVFTLGLLVLRRGATPPTVVGDPDPRRIFAWLIAATWVVCAIAILALYLRARSVRYVLTNERLRVTTGPLSTTTEDVELRRVRDTRVYRPAMLRLFGLGEVLLIAGDATTPRATLRAVRDPDGLQSMIRDLVQEGYARWRVREFDVM